MRSLILAVLAFAGCTSPYTKEELTITEVQEGCSASHPRVGSVADLKGYFHDVSGSVAIVDDCTLELRNFTFDGGGLDVRAIASIDGDFEQGKILTMDLRRSGGYDNETVRIPLPVGVTLDDVVHLSIWCIPAGANLGDTRFSIDEDESIIASE